jgi:hypothetical protein
MYLEQCRNVQIHFTQCQRWGIFQNSAAPWPSIPPLVWARTFDCVGKFLHIACGSGADSTRDAWTKTGHTIRAPRKSLAVKMSTLAETKRS